MYLFMLTKYTQIFFLRKVLGFWSSSSIQLDLFVYLLQTKYACIHKRGFVQQKFGGWQYPCVYMLLQTLNPKHQTQNPQS